MKKPGLIILLLLYIFTQLGTITWYYYQPFLHTICYIRFRLSSAGNDENEFIIKTTSAAFKKAKQDDSEIVWKGTYYDIKKVEVNGNEITITAEKDNMETKWLYLYHSIREQLAKNRSPNTPRDIRFCQWMFKLYVPATTIHSSIPGVPFLVHKHSEYQYPLPAFFTDGPCQPPDFC